MVSPQSLIRDVSVSFVQTAVVDLRKEKHDVEGGDEWVSISCCYMLLPWEKLINLRM